MDGFENYIMSSVPSENQKYEWVYNTKEISIWNMVFLDE